MEAKPDDVRRGQAIVRVLGCVLEKLIGASASESVGPEPITKFHSQKLPNISVLEYLERIQKYSYCSNECFVLALIYIDRLIQYNGFSITALNVHRVIITSVLLAAKFFDDQYFNNAHYAKVGGLPLSEMNALEVEFCFRISFSLHVTDVVYKKYHTELANHAKICGACVPFVPSFPKLDPYRNTEDSEFGMTIWSAENSFDEVDAGAHLKEHPYFRHVRTEVAPLMKAEVPERGEAASFTRRSTMNTANPVKVSYAPILNQCIDTWGVPTQIAVSGPMYYPLFYS